MGYSFLPERNIWQHAPILTGSTKFEPQQDVKNIMITGGEGFIASWLVRHLVLTYPGTYNVISFDKLDYCSSLNNTRALREKPNFTFYQGDITSPSEVIDCLNRYNIDTIFHFAAQSHVDLSFGNSYSFTETNVYGTHVLLESAKTVGIKRFIHISTGEVYGEVAHGNDDLPEASILSPTNPYAASKAAAEMLVNSYQKSFKLPVIIVRSNNVYGPHQYPEKIIPKFISLLHRGQPVILHGDGSPTRRYLFAGDAADAFDTILHNGEIGQIYNIGSSDEISNLQIYQRYAVDATKLKMLGWTQKTSFDEGLRRTIDWYKPYGDKWWGDISPVLTPFPQALSKQREEQAVTPTSLPEV
ncbi:Putative rhamnose biosynthetic enzyme 1 [Fusarium oxysporum f. sp. cubense race 1]|uniref:Putative rhamnose biosynthetic enzyme 1 n=1 Tax=Fusarium oxysporum f. sp. cubense (strain race 1) TaxID=1229664 RepID=N4V4P3_FUSC1|nr:Putative rhamnose biosynthetic enzyme 1 [Fusarium oxysporum f. sp. cubense race 1]